MSEEPENLLADRERRVAALHMLAERALQSQPLPAVTREAARSRARAVPPFMRRSRLWLSGLVVLITLAVSAALVFAFPALRPGASVQRATSTPVVPFASQIYFDPDIPWTTVLVDSRSVSEGKPGSVQAPLKLSAGRHVISWDAAPFPTKYCILSVPAVSTDTCPAAFEGIAHVPGEAPAEVLHLEENSYDLPVGTVDALNATVQAALNAATTGSPVQRGEPVYQASSIVSDGTYVATTRMELDFQGQGSICQVDLLSAIPHCDLVTNQCLPICSLDYGERQSLGLALPSDQWVAIAAVFMQRDFTSSAGEPGYPQQILSSGLVAFDDRSLLVGLSWHNNTWQAQPYIGRHLLAPSIADPSHRVLVDPACAAAEAYFAEYLSPDELRGYSQVRFVSGANVSAGCLIQATVATSGESVEYFERFGVLLALNNAAHLLHRNMPVASPYVRQLASQLSASTTAGIPMQYPGSGNG